MKAKTGLARVSKEGEEMRNKDSCGKDRFVEHRSGKDMDSKDKGVERGGGRDQGSER